MTAEIEVVHYGPNVVPDPDHSTSVTIKRAVPGNDSDYRLVQVLSLESDAELGELYRKLGEALRKGDIR